MEIESALKAVREVYVHYPKLHDQLQDDLKRLNDETQDLLHLIELTNCNACEGFKLYKELQRNRKERRIVKDQIDLLAPILEINKFGKPSPKNIDKCLGDVRKIKKNWVSRSYRMKVRKELQGKLG